MLLQAPQLYRLLSEAATALGLQRSPQLFLQHSQQAAMHYLELPVTSLLPGLPPPTAPKQRAPNSTVPGAVAGAGAGATQQTEAVRATSTVDSVSAAAVHQAAVVVTSRTIELLQPAELQAMFIGCLSSGLLAGSLLLLLGVVSMTDNGSRLASCCCLFVSL